MSTPDPDAAARMHAIAAALTAAGVTARVHVTRGALDVTATWERPDAKAAEVIVDEDGYAEIRYWNQSRATPPQVATVIVRALAAITATQRTQPPLAATGHTRAKPPGRSPNRQTPGAAPSRQLGGTGRVADDLYQMAHHELSGRVHLRPRALGLGLAGALLREPNLDEVITIADGIVVTARLVVPDNELARGVAERIAGEGSLTTDWGTHHEADGKVVWATIILTQCPVSPDQEGETR